MNPKIWKDLPCSLVEIVVQQVFDAVQEVLVEAAIQATSLGTLKLTWNGFL